jgi:hypothetical protein
VELDRQGDALSGQLLLIEPGLGTTRARILGTWTDKEGIEAEIDQFTAEFSVAIQLPQKGRLQGTLDAAGSVISGQWQTDAGTGGRFVLVYGPKIDPALPAQAATKGEVQPPQPVSASLGPLVTTTLTLGTVRLDRDALANLVEVLRNGLSVENPAINVSHQGHEMIHLGMQSLDREPSLPVIVETVIISASEPTNNTGNRTVVVRLTKDGPNTIFVSGYDQVWVEGKARQVELFLSNHMSRFAGFWRKYGNNANGVLFLILLGLLPSVPSLRDRFVVLAASFLLLVVMRLSWAKIAHSRIYLQEKLVPFHLKYSDWILTPLAVLLSGLIALLIARYIHPSEPQGAPTPTPVHSQIPPPSR